MWILGFLDVIDIAGDGKCHIAVVGEVLIGRGGSVGRLRMLTILLKLCMLSNTFKMYT